MTWSLAIEGQLGALQLKVDAEFPNLTLLVGPNGAGKTSLLRFLAGARFDWRGRVALGKRCLFDGSQGIWLPGHQRQLGYVPQGAALFPHLTVAGNVAFGANPSAAQAALEQFELEAIAKRTPASLSGGERQRVALARAVAAKPAAFLLDEPFAALDAAARGRFRERLKRALGDRPTILVTHDLRDLLAFGGEVVVMERGAVVQQGSLASLQQAPVSAFVRELLVPVGALTPAD